jgi:tRNA nucleotidyltransferase (CCA-adding enzyme)
MHVILTHEQADFDALGALLGAHLLHPEAIPVLPRRMNRNARAFIDLYGGELPFVDPRALPGEAIESVLLVDTQSLVTLKGMSAKTRVEVIDHHQLRGDLPAEWRVRVEPTGAATTLMVEEIQARGIRLTEIQASLLLMGIYEDTGALTYTATTPREARAAAFLLENGASLSLVGEYLNPPLSPEQSRLYDRLLAAAETIVINGQTIVVARAEATEMSEEISSVAHKMRDLLEPAALFLLVTTGEGIRMVARATTDAINVAEVAAHFGGGGHARAAAALIHPAETSANPLAEVYQELLRVLPQYVRPAVSVGQIMSKRPRVLKPDTPAEEAAQLMQRYGYEGFPVVQEGRVIGLLTRRAVDRALAHKLNLPAASLMEAGEVTVYPGDTLDHLQEVMTASGWGQVPVISPTTGEVVGIVTRTDLLKTLTGQAAQPAAQNLAERLEAALPAARLALLKAVAAKAHELRMAVYIVGGFVRDLLLERPSLDFDVVVEGDAITLGRALRDEYGGRVISHARFGTTKWDIAAIRAELAERLSNHEKPRAEDLPSSLDLITARIEFYEYPTALPTVERSSIKLDLHRRDFTINTLALRLDGRHYGELYDYWGGLHDLRKKLVRVLHSLSFIDDPTRMLRAVRFEQRFGFRIESRTLQLMEEARPMLKQVSGERIRHELDLILAEEKAAAMLARLDELGLLNAIHPELSWKAEHTERFEAILKEDIPPEWGVAAKVGSLPARRALAYILWLGCRPERQARSIARRLKLPTALIEALELACRAREELPALTRLPPSQATRRLEGTPSIALYALYRTLDDPAQRDLVAKVALAWRKVSPALSGHDLRAMGLPPGPAYREILGALRDARLDGRVHTEEEEREYVAHLMRQMDLTRGER